MKYNERNKKGPTVSIKKFFHKPKSSSPGKVNQSLRSLQEQRYLNTETPKGLLQVNGEPLIERVIRHFQAVIK